VSRHHAYVVWGPHGWSLHGIAPAKVFLTGKEVDRLIIDGPVELTLASPLGAEVRMSPVRMPSKVQSAQPASGSMKQRGRSPAQATDQLLAENYRGGGKS
jgi:hypothetical protein